MKKSILNIVLTSLALVASMPSYALKINTMILVGDEQGNGVFTLTNELPDTTFISGEISKIEMLDGKVKRIPYTADNLDDWDITLTHPKLILESGKIKQVGVRDLCGPKCARDKDRVYQIIFSPEPYNKEGKTSAVNINFGYAPIYVIPPKEPKVSYTMKNLGDKILVNNTGNTYIRFMIDSCTKQNTTKCKSTYTALAGRERTFNLPENVRSKVLDVQVVNFDDSYRKTIQVK